LTNPQVHAREHKDDHERVALEAEGEKGHALALGVQSASAIRELPLFDSAPVAHHEALVNGAHLFRRSAAPEQGNSERELGALGPSSLHLRPGRFVFGAALKSS
jgi:hypothetical protein